MPIKANKITIKNKQVESEDSSQLTKGDIQFLLEKMKTAQFTGAEFEQFYSIFTKLTTQLKNR